MKASLILVTCIMLCAGCAHTGPPGDTPFLDTTWKLVELGNEPIQPSGSGVPHIRFETDRVSGNDGCNNFFGGYARDGNKLTFGLLGSTRMACPGIDGFDTAFQKMLSLTSSYRITGDRLALHGSDGQVASFRAAGEQ